MFFNAFVFLMIGISDVTSTVFYSDLKKEEFATGDLPPRGYGLYYLHVRYLESCEPDTAIDVKSDNQYNFDLKYDDQQLFVYGYIYVPNDYHCVKAIFIPTLLKSNKSDPVFQKITNSPCTDLLVALPLKQLTNVDSECVVKKGNYTLNKFMPNVWIHNIFKRQLIYERLKVDIAYYSKVGRTFCLKIVVDIKPSKKAKKKLKAFL